MLGDMSEHWSVFLHKHKNKLASCGTPSFPERNVIHEKNSLIQLQALDVTAAGIASYTSGASSQASNQRLDCTPSSTTTQHTVVTVSRTVGWSG